MSKVNTTISELLSDENSVSNPFDVFVQTSLELARASLFFQQRFKNTDSGFAIRVEDMDSVKSYYERMCQQFEILNSIPQEELEICRKTSFYSDNDKFSSLNKELFEKSQGIPTIYSDSNPYINTEFEELVYGKDSDKYKRHAYLREVVCRDYSFSREDLCKCCDILTHGLDYCKYHFGISDKDAEHLQGVIDCYNLTTEDCDYMCSCIKVLR